MNRGILYITVIFCSGFVAAAELEYAVQYESVERVQQLLGNGAQLTANACVLVGMRDAVARYFFLYINEMRACLLRGCAVPARDPAYVYQLLDALLVYTTDVSLVRSLLLAGARVGYQDAHGNTALVAAQKAGCREKEVMLLHQDERVYDQLLVHVQNESLSEEFLQSHFTGLNRLNINRPYAEQNWRTALFIAVIRNYTKGVLLLLRYGAKGAQYALWLAVQHACKKIIQMLCAHGARLWALPGALQIVVTSNQQAHAIVPWLAPLVSQGERNDALIAACLNADEKLFDDLLRSGASLYYQDRQGVSPLYASIIGHSLPLVKKIAVHKKQQLDRDQLLLAKTLFSDAYTLLVASDTAA